MITPKQFLVLLAASGALLLTAYIWHLRSENRGLQERLVAAQQSVEFLSATLKDVTVKRDELKRSLDEALAKNEQVRVVTRTKIERIRSEPEQTCPAAAASAIEWALEHKRSK